MIIRPIQESDVNDLSRLIERVAQSFLFPDFTEEGKQNFLNSVTGSGIIKNLNEGFEYWLAENDNQIIGIIALKNKTHLYNLFIDADFHGKGIARKLWDKAIHGSNVKTYTVFSSSYAVPIYEKLGFVISGDPVNDHGIYAIPMIYKVHLKK